MKRIILTIPQARALQQSGEWPGEWHLVSDLNIPEEPDVKPDARRMTGGADMLARGCTIEQVELQMNWKENSLAIMALIRQHTGKGRPRSKPVKKITGRRGNAPSNFTLEAKKRGLNPTKARYVLTTREATVEEVFDAMVAGTQKALPLRTSPVPFINDDFGPTQDEKAATVGLSKATISSRAKALNMTFDEVVEAIHRGNADGSR
ncbi:MULTISPECIES: hypothetical protein [unclassified Sphingomonas]|uniref:hypothetical protein n=1 Tax=Sphingomonas sp. PvP015 TaxID=3156388 RepID=UPI00339A6A8C